MIRAALTHNLSINSQLADYDSGSDDSRSPKQKRSWKPWKSSPQAQESPKVALRRNRATAWKTFLLFHLIPVGGTLTLIVINIQGYAWGFPANAAIWISSLQFLAKFLEILIQTSIGVVMLAYLQHLLIHEQHIPLGAVFSYYQATQLSYLWSKEFWGALSAEHFQGLLRAGFLCFIPLNFLLIAAVGPSSAIAMLPRLSNSTAPDLLVSFNVSSAELFPSAIIKPGPALRVNQTGYTAYHKSCTFIFYKNHCGRKEFFELEMSRYLSNHYVIQMDVLRVWD